jgi:kynurenine formamidase
MPLLILVLPLCSWIGCQASDRWPAGRWIDLTHDFSDDTVYWPTGKPFQLDVVSAGITEKGYYYAANNFCSAEHCGTHMDAPIHFAEGRQTADEVPLDRLIGAGIVIDVSERALRDPDYQVTVDDLHAWTTRHGTIPSGAIVLLRTGHGRYYADRVRYLGTDKQGPEAVPELHFPGLHHSAARWLVERRAVKAVGLDTPSIDYGQSTRFETHQVLAQANTPVFENLARLDQLPAQGFLVVALPMKIKGGSGGPLRIVAAVRDPR